MAQFQQLTIGSRGPERLADADGGMVLVFNNDASNDVWLNDDPFNMVADPGYAAPLPPGGTVVLDGTSDVWGICAAGKTAVVTLIPGGRLFFQFVEILVKTLLVSASAGNGIFVYDPAPAIGKLIASVTAQTGTDPEGNTTYAGVSVYDPASGNVIELDAGTIFLFNQVSGAWFATISPQGLLVYSGPPALGNLVASITAAAGVDSHGNAFLQGISSYTNIGNFAQLLNSVLTFGLTGSGFAGNPDVGTDAGGQQLIINSASNGTSNGTEIALDLNQVTVQKQAGAPAGTLLNVVGIIAATGAQALPAVHPGTASTIETWQSMNTRGYQTGWADSGNNPPGRWRLTASPASWVQMQGSLNTGTTADNTVILNLPLVYHPAQNHGNFSGRLIVPSNAAVQGRLNVFTSGNVTITGLSALGAGVEVVIPEGSGYSLD